MHIEIFVTLYRTMDRLTALELAVGRWTSRSRRQFGCEHGPTSTGIGTSSTQVQWFHIYKALAMLNFERSVSRSRLADCTSLGSHSVVGKSTDK
jgi:hypothetical protein